MRGILHNFTAQTRYEITGYDGQVTRAAGDGNAHVWNDSTHTVDKILFVYSPTITGKIFLWSTMLKHIHLFISGPKRLFRVPTVDDELPSLTNINRSCHAVQRYARKVSILSKTCNSSHRKHCCHLPRPRTLATPVMYPTLPNRMPAWLNYLSLCRMIFRIRTHLMASKDIWQSPHPCHSVPCSPQPALRRSETLPPSTPGDPPT
jgi:hypothetical protein